MTARREIRVLLVEDHAKTRALYVEALTAAGCVVRAVESPNDVVPVALAARFDVAVLDIGWDRGGFAIAERLAALSNRPRLIAVTARTATGVPREQLFDRYLVKPCLPDALVEAVRSVAMLPTRHQDLLIVARERVGIDDVTQRFGDSAAGVEIRWDLRRGQRRRARDAPAPRERRRRDRRTHDVSDQLRTNGWAFIAAAAR